jgi:hypothetical protein
MPVERGDNELDRVLHQQFPKAGGPGGGKTPPGKRPGGLKGFGDENSVQSMKPGFAYSGGVQPQQGGMAGQTAAAAANAMAGKPGCPDWMNKACLDILSRMLEETFHNFQMTARRPSHIDMPFRAYTLDEWTRETTSVPNGSYANPGPWTTIVTFVIPNLNRGAVVAAGQGVDVVNAWNYLEWRIVLNGLPHYKYNSVRMQLWELCPVSPLYFSINLEPGVLAQMQVRNWSPTTSYNAWGRLVGWYYPVRSEDGGSIRSTLVD